MRLKHITLGLPAAGAVAATRDFARFGQFVLGGGGEGLIGGASGGS